MNVPSGSPQTGGTLAREMGVLGLVATGVCAMVGAAINVIPFMIQRNVPGIGASVLPAYLLAAVPALFAALAYAILASAMPRAGGSYVYASRGLDPYLGFVASFSQWFSLCVAIGVVSYLLVPFLRDVAIAAGASGMSAALETSAARLVIPIAVLWTFVGVNLRGIAVYQRTVVPLMFLTLILGGLVIVAGFSYSHNEFIGAVPEAAAVAAAPGSVAGARSVFVASVLLFSSFIGFDTIAQAGGEARDAARTLPLAIGIAIIGVAAFYFLFTAAVYHAVPWQWVAEQAQRRDLTAPGLLAPLLPRPLTVVMVSGAAVALMKDLPAMLLGTSRLMFAWAEDGIFPAAVARVHPVRRTPDTAILASGAMATAGILGSHLAGDFFLGVDILVISMLINFLLMSLAVLTLPGRNPALATRVRVVPQRGAQVALAGAGVLVIGAFLVMHVWRDVTADTAWYFRSTNLWLVMLGAASLIYWRERGKLVRRGVDVQAVFSTLPPE
jgi:APA family basic amino acid/polyamine antiporter